MRNQFTAQKSVIFMQRPSVPPGTFVNELTKEGATPSLQMKVHTNICYKTEQLMADIR